MTTFRHDGLDNPCSPNSGTPGISSLREFAEQLGVSVEISGPIHGPYDLVYSTGETENDLDYVMAAKNIRLMGE